MTKRAYVVVTFDVCVTEQASLVAESLQQLSNKHGVLHQKPAANYVRIGTGLGAEALLQN